MNTGSIQEEMVPELIRLLLEIRVRFINAYTEGVGTPERMISEYYEIANHLKFRILKLIQDKTLEDTKKFEEILDAEISLLGNDKHKIRKYFPTPNLTIKSFENGTIIKQSEIRTGSGALVGYTSEFMISALQYPDEECVKIVEHQEI